MSSDSPSSEASETAALEALIPHRPPFRFVDRILEMREDGGRFLKTWRVDEPFYAGHYPGNPITPGVLMCEAVFQAAAAFMSQRFPNVSGGTPVLSRIQDAKFKRIVRPGDVVEIEVTYKEAIKEFHFMRGVVRKDGKVAVAVEFALAMVQDAE